MLGAGMVKWTALDLCLGSSESDSKVNTYFDLWEEKIHRRSHYNIDLQSQEIYNDENNSKKNLHSLEDGASGVQVGDIGQVNVYFFFQIR